MGKAYWYKNGKLIEVGINKYKFEVNDLAEFGKTHIHDLVDNPEIFGYTEKQIKDIYKKYGEDVGYEGKAREEIMKDVILNKGWVRLRHVTTKGNDHWILQFNSLTKQRKQLQNLISTLILDKKVMYKTDRVVLNGLGDNSNEVFDGFVNKDNSILTFLEGKEEKVQTITEYKYFNY